ncbi:diaminopimelate dehydrogenase [Fundicoccus culcitae]|uniref:Meso-diaminopimelate D-dehydrogenase n=1 Tax=Fundicoccus culcitae TaxID=2969821 RepID=A0ABY5P4Q8_9LACT|nr:diaminopimelate dehydrogenase [Fundicoccus culcitae]UUX33679.1 diaminopimelate dehydrogenase [Fundicoccus culcitae]
MIKVGIVGYGNLGRGVEANIKNAPDMELVGIFTRREPESIKTESPVFGLDLIYDFKGMIDVLILCGGSRTDIPEQGPMLAEYFNTVDSYDNHAQIPLYFASMDHVAQTNRTVSVIATGWDPGLFSLNRLLGEAILPKGNTYTFWGKGLSQGHGDAVRRIEGVKDAVQYTIPNEELINKINIGEEVVYDSHTAHTREVYAVLEEGADAATIENEIVTMPDYFEGYQTRVHFISEEELAANHQGLPHGGHVIRSGYTSENNHQLYDFKLQLGSNPEFTAAVNVAYARAAARLAKEGVRGAKTVFDIAPAYLSPYDADELRERLL